MRAVNHRRIIKCVHVVLWYRRRELPSHGQPPSDTVGGHDPWRRRQPTLGDGQQRRRRGSGCRLSDRRQRVQCQRVLGERRRPLLHDRRTTSSPADHCSATWETFDFLCRGAFSSATTWSRDFTTASKLGALPCARADVPPPLLLFPANAAATSGSDVLAAWSSSSSHDRIDPKAPMSSSFPWNGRQRKRAWLVII